MLKNRKTQYDNVIFYRNQAQKKILSDIFQNKGYEMSDVETRIEKLNTYYYAEDYHQKYKLRNHKSLENQFTEFYDAKQFRDSSLATKMNSLVDGKLEQSDFSIPDEIEFEENIFDRIVRNFKN
jgi:peptide methionine sulfoxide reductase msrA/msrB